ncbi:hypothetical protein [Streptomyces sp. NPDC050145]|uniref:hypothetical protein n=1 Tax=Streptomyces sp. NPDC050145 TaxID=3365602 RepID=UPI0037A80CEA
MTAEPARPECGDPETSSTTSFVPFKSPLVKAVFRDVTPLHVSRSAVLAAASVARTVLTGIVDGARRAAAEEGRRKLVPGDFVAAIDRNVELEVAGEWFGQSPTFRGLNGVRYDAEGVVVPAPRRGSRRSSAVVGAHRFEGGVRKLLRSRGVRAVPAVVRDLDATASVFLTNLARDAAMVVREGGIKRFGSVTLMLPGEPASPPAIEDSLRSLAVREGDGRTVGRDDVLAATTMQLFGDIRQRALTAARAATQNNSAG